MRDVKKSSPAARVIGTFLGHRSPVTSSIRAKDSWSSGEDILPRGLRTSPSTPQQNYWRPPVPHCSTYFSLLRGWGGLLRRAFLSHSHWPLPAAVDSVIPGIAAVRQAIQLEDPIQPNVGSTDIPTPQGLRLRHITPHNTCSPVFRFTHECGGNPAMQIQREGWTSHSLPTQGGHLARAYFAQHPAM
jgi:hypothetical protein